jgi:hypothetical protein
VSKKCKSCTKSKVLKDAERRVENAREMEQRGEKTVSKIMDEMTAPEIMDETTVPKTNTPPAMVDEWCCMYRVLSLQDDFLTETPMIQSIIEKAGHVCLFLLRFHCELNTIELLWGYAKHCV